MSRRLRHLARSATTRDVLATLFLTILIDLIGFGLLMPILPHYIAAFGAGAITFGLLMSSYALMQFLCAPLWGKLSDRMGRRPVLLITIAGGAVSMLLLSTAQTLFMVFAGRILSGIFAGNIGLATAYITDVTDEQHRARGMGLIGIAFGVGFIIGPALGSALAPFGPHVPILCGAALGAINLAQALFTLREPPIHVQRAAHVAPLTLWQRPALRALVAYNFWLTLVMTQLEATIVYYLADRFHYDSRHAGYLLAFSAFMMALVQGGVVRRIRSAHESHAFVLGVLLCAVSLVLFPNVYWLSGLLSAVVFSALGRGLAQPMLLSLISKHAAADERGSVMGTTQAAASLARVIGPAGAGWLYAWQPASPFLLASVVMVILAAVAARRFFRTAARATL